MIPRYNMSEGIKKGMTPQLEIPVEILIIFLRNDLTQFSSANIIDGFYEVTNMKLSTKRVNDILDALTTSGKLVVKNVASDQPSTKTTRFYRLNLKFAQGLLSSITIPLPVGMPPLDQAKEVPQTNGEDKSPMDKMIDDITDLAQELPDSDE